VLDLDANSQQGPDDLSVLVYVLAGCGATLLCLMGVCGFAVFCWCLHHRQVRAQSSTTPHCTALHHTAPSITPPAPLSRLALQMRALFQTYVEPASIERGSSPHLQLQKLEDARMPSELWEAESNRSLQPLPVSPSDPARAATSDTLQRAQGELSQHWLSLSSLHTDLPRSPRERREGPHDDEPQRIARPCEASSGAASVCADSVMRGEVDGAGVGTVQPSVAVPSDQPIDTQRTVVRL